MCFHVVLWVCGMWHSKCGTSDWHVTVQLWKVPYHMWLVTCDSYLSMTHEGHMNCDNCDITYDKWQLPERGMWSPQCHPRAPEPLHWVPHQWCEESLQKKILFVNSHLSHEKHSRCIQLTFDIELDLPGSGYPKLVVRGARVDPRALPPRRRDQHLFSFVIVFVFEDFWCCTSCSKIFTVILEDF